MKKKIRRTRIKIIKKIIPKKKIIISKTSIGQYPKHLNFNEYINQQINDYIINSDQSYQLKNRIPLSTRSKNGEKISIIVACMNRYDNLRQCVENWINYDELYEIIVLDYGSKIPIENSSIHKLSDKIKLYRTEADHWHLTRAYNIAAQYVSGDIILKMDADYIIKSGFFNHHLSYNGFIYGGGGTGGLYGFLCLYKTPFFLLNGYNERIINYGHDDKDLFLRCQYVAAMKPLKINKNLLFHIPHSDYDRICNQKIKENRFRSIMRNTRIARANPWSNKDIMTSKDVAFRII